jgi:hypothetical protein
MSKQKPGRTMLLKAGQSSDIRSGIRGTKGPKVEKPIPKYADVKSQIKPVRHIAK